MRPGVNVTTRDNAPPTSIPVDVATAFMVGITEAGPTVPNVSDLVQNIEEYKAKWAPSGQAYAAGIGMFNAASSFFKRRGNRLYVGRVVGVGAVKAKIDVPQTGGGSPPVAFTVEAKGFGEYANSYTATIQDTAVNAEIGAGAFRIVLKSGTTVLESSYDLADTLAAQSWAVINSDYITVKPGAGTADPSPGDYALTGGLVDVGTIVDANWTAALANLSVALGPGTLSAPGMTTDAIHIAAAKHAEINGRVAFLDGADTATAATLIAASKAVIDASGKRSRYSSIFSPWVVVAGDAPGSIVKVPPAPVVQAVFASNMASGISANQPSAGERGILDIALDLTQSYSDADRQAMNAQGVNVLRDIFGTRKVYGWRTTADPVNDPRWIGLGNTLLHRQIIALANAVGERFIFRQIDGQGRLFTEFNGTLNSEVCMPLFLAGSLFGESPSEAYRINTASVNTPATIANNELHAVISVRMSPFTEEIDIEVVKYLVTEPIPA